MAKKKNTKIVEEAEVFEAAEVAMETEINKLFSKFLMQTTQTKVDDNIDFTDLDNLSKVLSQIVVLGYKFELSFNLGQYECLIKSDKEINNKPIYYGKYETDEVVSALYNCCVDFVEFYYGEENSR